MFNENEFREKINMSGVNSINWARIICQIVYYFYAAFKFNNKRISFAVPTGNFGDIYAGYIAKKMGLGIDKLIVATNENDILQRVINKGEYKPDQVKASLSPSMDIQISSNFERLLFDIVSEDDKKVSLLMDNLSSKGFFELSKEEVEIIKKDFCAEKINNKDTLSIIQETHSKSNFILDPHTATAVGAAKKINDLSNTVVLGTAHPYKFLETVKMATGKEVQPPIQFSKIEDKEEKYDILENDISKIKNYILEKIA
jgi:threonine synthase